MVGMVVCAYDLSTWDIEAGGSGTERSVQATQQVQDQSGFIRSGLSKWKEKSFPDSPQKGMYLCLHLGFSLGMSILYLAVPPSPSSVHKYIKNKVKTELRVQAQ